MTYKRKYLGLKRAINKEEGSLNREGPPYILQNIGELLLTEG